MKIMKEITKKENNIFYIFIIIVLIFIIYYLITTNNIKENFSQGIVKWFDKEKGYGFITPNDGSDDLFAHFSQIIDNGFKTLENDQQVGFDISFGPKGAQASNIKPL